ncbi:MAG: hypothetical protein ED559_00540 [Phycisphaera sp.]|nr:MAG: hypothetical protein ED559_00540 [Phycisphaera sp.]
MPIRYAAGMVIPSPLGAIVVALLVAAPSTAAQVAYRAFPLYDVPSSGALNVSSTFVSDAGDVNNDGTGDVIIRMGDDGNGNDVVAIISGATGSPLYTYAEPAGTAFGDSVSGAGDVNNDGFDDFIIGALDNTGFPASGTPSVYSGATGSVIHTFSGDDPNNPFGDFFGAAVSGAGDVNNDGFDDVIIGAFSDDTNGVASGRAYVFSGATGQELYSFFGVNAFDAFGDSLGGVGDVNNDGFDDFAIVAPNEEVNNETEGRTRVYSGATGAVLYTIPGGPGLGAMSSVSDAGDVNNDGTGDFILGFTGNSQIEGTARVYSGATGAVLFVLTSPSGDEEFGFSVSGAGDANGDGFDDVIVGSPMGSRGSASVFSGATGEELISVTNALQFNLGQSVSGAGDVNNDGLDDLIVASPGRNAGTLGIATVYESALVPIGAACLPDGSCVDGVTEAEAAALGGTFRGAGSVCDGTCPPPLGACCIVVDGTCIQLTEDECAQLGDGLWLGAETICDANNDGVPDGMCNPPGTCRADVNGDGFVTPTDFTAWINAYNNNLPECDQNGDAACTPTDFTAWIANFNAGC